MKVCVIGAGRWGKNHVRTLHEMGVLSAVIEGSDEIRNSLKDLYPDIKLFSSLQEAGALDYEAYTVVVPAEHHFSVAKQLLEAGKHVLVEKPITLTSEDAKSLCELADKKSVTLMVGHLLLFHPAFIKMKKLIQDGKLGKIEYIYSNRLNLGTVRTEENSLWSFAPHDISLFLDFIGEFPDSVSCNGGAFLQSHIHDTTVTNLSFPNNVKGHIFVSWLHPFKEHRFVIIGSKGMLSYEDSNPNKELLFYEKGIDWVNGEPIKRDGPTESISYPQSQPLKEELHHFINAAQGKDENTQINGQNGLDVLSVLEMAEVSLSGNDDQRAPKDTVLSVADLDYFVHESAYVDHPSQVGKGAKIWHYSHIQKGAVIGEDCRIGQNVNIASNVKIGKNVKIQNNVSVYEGVELEDYVFCGPSMVFTNINIPRSKYPQAESKYYQKTLVKEGASIGANATIVCGVTIGRFAFIGAGAVITKDVPDFAVVLGNPGKVVGWMSEAGMKLCFDAENIVFCEKSQKRYKLENNIVLDSKGDNLK